MKQGQRIDLLIILLLPLLASYISFAFQASFFVSMILFLGVPAIYLSIRNPRMVKKLLPFAFIFGIPFTVSIDYIMETTGAWYAPTSIFDPHRFLGVVAYDMILWGILYFYLVALFYETFLDRHLKPEKKSPRFPYFFAFCLYVLLLFLLIYLFVPSALFINYFYLKFGIVLALLPILFELVRRSRLRGKFFAATLYFLYFSLIYELTALSLGQWAFPNTSQFVGAIEIFHIRFPLEEFVFWILLGAGTTLSFYEFFDDDEK